MLIERYSVPKGGIVIGCGGNLREAALWTIVRLSIEPDILLPGFYDITPSLMINRHYEYGVEVYPDGSATCMITGIANGRAVPEDLFLDLPQDTTAFVVPGARAGDPRPRIFEVILHRVQKRRLWAVNYCGGPRHESSLLS